MNNLINCAFAAVSNPYLYKISQLLNDVKGWILGIIGGITVVVIAFHGVQYQKGDSSDKAKAIKDIKSDILMGGGIFMLVWFGSYVVQAMQ